LTFGLGSSRTDNDLPRMAKFDPPANTAEG